MLHLMSVDAWLKSSKITTNWKCSTHYKFLFQYTYSNFTIKLSIHYKYLWIMYHLQLTMYIISDEKLVKLYHIPCHIIPGYFSVCSSPWVPFIASFKILPLSLFFSSLFHCCVYCISQEQWHNCCIEDAVSIFELLSAEGFVLSNNSCKGIKPV